MTDHELLEHLLDVTTSATLHGRVCEAADFALRQHTLFLPIDDYVADVVALVARRAFLAGLVSGSDQALGEPERAELVQWLQREHDRNARTALSMHGLLGWPLPAWLLEALLGMAGRQA